MNTRCADLSQDLGQLDLNRIIQGAGQLLQGQVPSAAIDSVSFWTNYSPRIKYSGKQLDDIYRDPTPNPYLALIQPTVVVESAFGKKTFAPYGVADEALWKANVTQAALLTASVGLLTGTLIWVWGRSVGRKGG